MTDEAREVFPLAWDDTSKGGKDFIYHGVVEKDFTPQPYEEPELVPKDESAPARVDSSGQSLEILEVTSAVQDAVEDFANATSDGSLIQTPSLEPLRPPSFQTPSPGSVTPPVLAPPPLTEKNPVSPVTPPTPSSLSEEKMPPPAS